VQLRPTFGKPIGLGVTMSENDHLEVDRKIVRVPTTIKTRLIALENLSP
jgi:hypothetical protein